MLSLSVGNILSDTLLNKFYKGPIKVKGFAGDAALVVKSLDIPSLLDRGQGAINIATSFGRDDGLEFGAEKTMIVMFTQRWFDPTQMYKL